MQENQTSTPSAKIRAKTKTRIPLSIETTNLLIEAAGGISAIAALMGTTKESVYNWRRRGMPRVRAMILRATYPNLSIMNNPEIKELTVQEGAK